MALTLVRHTRLVAADGLCYGRTELPLAASFPAEAEALLAGLARPDRIATSPLDRCRRLAELVGGRLGLPVAVDPDLAEMDFGRWEGRPWDAIPAAEVDTWAADVLDARPHGGESVAMLLARVRRALATWGAGATLAVTHKGVIRAALVALGDDPGGWRRDVEFGEAVVLPAAADD